MGSDTRSYSEEEIIRGLLDDVLARRARHESHEWKITLGLWGGTLLLTNIVVSNSQVIKDGMGAVRGSIAALLVFAVAATVLALHYLWIYAYVRPCHLSDRRLSIQLEEDLRERAGLGPLPDANMGKIGSSGWEQRFEFGVSALILGGSALILATTLGQ